MTARKDGIFFKKQEKMIFNQQKINELTTLINDAQFHLDRLDAENKELKEIHEAHQKYYNDMETENKIYYLTHLMRRKDHQNNIDVFEVIYSNGLKEITKYWKYGETINTIIYDNE